jgi:hypothetical protein
MIACLASSQAFQVGNARQPPPSVRHHENRPSCNIQACRFWLPFQTSRKQTAGKSLAMKNPLVASTFIQIKYSKKKTGS